MKPYQAEPSSVREQHTTPSDELRIGVTFKRPQDGLGPTKLDARISARSVSSMRPDPLDVDRALYELHRRGFVTTVRGRLTASVRATRRQFEELFGTRLVEYEVERGQAAQFQAFYYPPDTAPWNPDPAVAALIDDAYIQWPHLYMAGAREQVAAPARTGSRGRGGGRPGTSVARRATAAPAPQVRGPSAVPPGVPYHHLEVPHAIAQALNALPVHQAGTTGKGVRVVMVDTGFAHAHPYFAANGYHSTVALAPHATNRGTDPNGHGSGESANVFAVAPNATFVGVKVENDDDPRRGASLLEGFQEALRHDPQVISVSMGYDLRGPDGAHQLTQLPRGLAALEAEIQAAVAAGVVVVFSAGNGHYSFPGQMKEVISAGGVYVDAGGQTQASDYASAFTSAIYSGRAVPDFCGLVGMLPHADYISLPIPPGCEIDRDNARHDATRPDDGWGVFSGTSAAAPQLAGVCALLLEKDPHLTPADVKAILKRTARDVASGHANPASDPDGRGVAAAPGYDGATGAGLVDAFAAWRQV